jgi:hypothetical protein
MKTEKLKALVDELGKKYSEVLDIDLSMAKDEEVFKWFLVSLLFGAPITETAVIKTYQCFSRYKVLTPKKILATGWDGLVKILDEGSYTRYDFKTADKLLLAMRNLVEKHGGSLNNLHDQASDSRDLEKRLRELGKGIGNITVSIFLRELRGIWSKADPYPTPMVVESAKLLGIVDRNAGPEDSLRQLKAFWSKNHVKGKSFVNFETALLRFEKDYVTKGEKTSFL